MKNRKGFTLIEILVTIAIIGIILLIAIPTIITVSNSIKKRALETKKQSIISAAELYAKNNSDSFGDANQIEVIVGTLISSGYLTIDSECEENNTGCIINPVDNTSMNNESILIKRLNSVIQADFGSIPLVERIIYFNGNGAGESDLGAVALSCQSTASGTCEVEAPSITRSGYTTLGWNNSSNETTSSLSVGGAITLSAETTGSTYYAITSKVLTATFNKNNTSDISTNSGNCTIYNTGTSCSVTTPTITASTGYTVLGWNTSSSATTASVNVNSDLSITSNTTYYAIQTKTPIYTCSIAATSSTTYTCPSGYTSSGSGSSTTCSKTTTSTYEATKERVGSFGYSYVCNDNKPSGDIKCSGAGGYWDKACSDAGQCELSDGIVTKWKCRSSCTTQYVCNSGGTLSGSTCTVTSTSTTSPTSSTTYSCSTGTKSETTCYLYEQSSCPTGWTSTEE